MKKTQEQISHNMRQVKSKNTKIEILLQKELWHRGLRYQKNVKDIIGKPDIVFKGPKVAVFCDSEFWHGYDWENKKSEIKTNQEFWYKKISANMTRDQKVTNLLTEKGWLVLRFWGKDILKNCSKCADLVEKEVRARHKSR